MYEAVSVGNSIFLDSTSEQYYYCGGDVKVSSSEMCSIQSSEEVIGQINQYGALPVGNEVSDVFDVSKYAQFYFHILVR